MKLKTRSEDLTFWLNVRSMIRRNAIDRENECSDIVDTS
jgi:hypothetical protein